MGRRPWPLLVWTCGEAGVFMDNLGTVAPALLCMLVPALFQGQAPRSSTAQRADGAPGPGVEPGAFRVPQTLPLLPVMGRPQVPSIAAAAVLGAPGESRGKGLGPGRGAHSLSLATG